LQSAELFKQLPRSPENLRKEEVLRGAMAGMESKLGGGAPRVRSDLRTNLLQAMAVKG
jgi:hypothetical protein